MENGISRKEGKGSGAVFRFKKRFINVLQPRKARACSSTTVLAPSIEPDRPPTPAIKKESLGFVAEISVGEKSDLVAATEGEVALSQSNLQDDAAPAMDIDLVAQNKANIHQDDTPDVKNPPSPPPTSDRDLWAEAWKADGLTDDARKRLQTPWKDLRKNSSSESTEVSKGDKSIEHIDKAAEASQKGGNTTKRSDYVQQVIHGTKQKLKDYQDRWGSQSNTTAAGTARDVLVSVLTIKQIVDAGLKFDLSGYGACAWAVVSFGLTLVNNDRQRMDLAFEATKYLSELLTRYSKTEFQYCKMPFKGAKRDTKELEDAIVAVYVAMLNYSAAVKQAADGSPLSRIKGSFIALTEEPLNSLKKIIEEKDAIVGKWKDDVDREYETQFWHYTQKSLEGIGDEATKILDNLENLQKDMAATRKGVECLVDGDVLEWLSPMNNSSAEKHGILRAAIEKLEGKEYREGQKYRAGQWFMQKRQYCNWKAYPQSVLWLRAPSGCGKSSLCSSIVEDLIGLRDATKPCQKLLLYWYFQFDKKDTKDLTPVLRSFLRQLGSSPDDGFPKEIKEWLMTVRHRDPPPKKQTLLEKVKYAIKVLKLDIFIVLDGLDEFPLQSRHEVERKDVLELVSGLIKDANPNLHILLVSKPENDIREYLQDDDELKHVIDVMNVEDGLNNELGDFIDTTMVNDQNFKTLGWEIKNEMTKRLNEGEEKSFLWVTSLLDDLHKCGSKEDQIREQLKKVPDSMATKYDQGLASVNMHNTPAIRLILIWLLRHQRVGEPLTEEEVVVVARLNSVSEVAELLVRALVKTSERTLESARHNNDQPSRYIEFVHFSAKEHLEVLLRKAGCDGATARPWYSFSDVEAHHEMATRCLHVLLDGRPEDHSLTSYAAQHWHKHYMFVTKTPPAEKVAELDQLVEKLFTPNTAAFDSWLGYYNPDDDFAPSDFDMKRGGAEEEEEEEQQDDDDSSSNNGNESDGKSDGESHKDRKPLADPVYYAVKLKLLDMAIKMMEKGTPHARPGREGTVLQLALYHTHWDVTDAVLRYSDDPKTAAAVRGGPHGTPLYIASAMADDERVYMVKKLIDNGARANGANEGKYGSALHAAAYFGRSAAVQELLDKGGASVDQIGGMFGTALQAAAAEGHNDVVKLLLDHEATPTIVSGLFGTALQAALACEKESTAVELQKAIKKHGMESSNRRSIGWESAVDRLESSNGMLLHDYTSLFPMPKQEDFQMPEESDLMRRQVLLAGVLECWDLRGADDLSRCRRRLTRGFPYQAPAVEQLEEIQRALPNFINNCSREHELNRQDFFYKALFWSGINYILKNLDRLIEHAMMSMEHAFRRIVYFSDRDYMLLGRWGEEDFHSRHLERRVRRLIDADRWLYERQLRERMARRERNLYLRSAWDLDYDRELRSWDYRFRTRYRFRDVDMDLSDKFVLEMARQQQLLQKQLSRQDQGDDLTKSLGKGKTRLGSIPSTGFEGEGGPDDSDDNDADADGNTGIHLVVDSFLPLVKDIVEFGKQCDRLHGIATARRGKDGTSDPAAEAIESLTFEVFAAVARLAVSVDRWQQTDSDTTAATANLAQTVRLLGTVRLARMARLAVAASPQLPQLQNEDDTKSDKNDATVLSDSAASGRGDGDKRLLPLQEAAADIAAAVAERLVGKNSWSSPPQGTGTAAATLDKLPALIREEVAPVLDHFRDQMCEQMQDLVKDAVRSEMERRQQAAEVMSLPPPEKRRSRGWGGFSWGLS